MYMNLMSFLQPPMMQTCIGIIYTLNANRGWDLKLIPPPVLYLAVPAKTVVVVSKWQVVVTALQLILER